MGRRPLLLPRVALLMLLILQVIVECRSENSSSSATATVDRNRISKNAKPFNFRCLDGGSSEQLKFSLETTSDNSIAISLSPDPLPLKPNPNAGNLTIQVSRRILPQLLSRVYAIFLQDVLKTGQQIRLKTENEMIKSFIEVGHVSLETWQFPDDHDHDKAQNNHHGMIYYTTGTMGWFIPKDLIQEG